MGRSTIPPALMELSNPSTPEAQVNALRNLKNEIVGHEQRKELAVVHGVVKPLARLLRTETRKGGKKRRGVTNGNSGVGRNTERAEDWTTEDELRFQATLVVGSLANGGSAFITPLLAGNVLPPLLEALSPAETCSKLVVTTLRTLNQIVDAVAQEKPFWESSPSLLHAVNQQLYTKPVVERLAEILAQTSRSRTVYQQISSATQLIIKTCREENQKKMLVETGVLDLLTAKMTAIAALDNPSQRQESKHVLGEALPTMYLPDILEAISTIIKDSNYHMARFLYSQHIQHLFGWPKGPASGSYEGYGTSQTNAWDKLIPRLQTLQSKSDPYNKSWPALGSYTAASGENYPKLPSMESIQQGSSRNVVTDEPETPLFTWLMFVARRGEGRERLAACWLLALLKKFGERWSLNDPSKTTRERHFSYLIIPLVAQMIEEANPVSESLKKSSTLDLAERDEMQFVIERAPLVLAELVASNKTLQNAAVDAKILPRIVQMLKKSFDPVTTSTKPLWQPRTSAPPVRDPMIDPASSTLGQPGLSPTVLHAYRYRESTLLALAAIADNQDALRKLIIEMGSAPLIIDSLVPYQGSPSDSSSQGAEPSPGKEGNPEAVLIAACKVTRSLSRSISVLRTSLIDHGIAQPSFDLLTHPNVKVQIAATEVITNLVLEVSPMRTEIIEAGALKTLCEHCRSANFDLRYGSIWALKHLCLGLPYEMKINCLDELGVGWLVQVLNGELSKPAASAPLAMGTANAAGEQVDILNAVEDPDMDVDEEPSSSEDEDTMTDSIPSMRRHQGPGSRYTSSTNIRERLQQIKDDEQDARLNNERDDIRIQEQALDFIRNFITEEKASGDMIDHLLKSFGHSAFFELLSSKLRPKGSTPSATSTASQPTSAPTAPSIYWPPTPSRLSFPAATPTTLSQTNWAAYPATDLIIATLYILVHLANGHPSHRTLLISETPLMTHILPLLTHPRRDVRLPCAWLINNLVWVEDATDEPATRDRAQRLRVLGFEDGARLLGRDIDLDIRERAKTAIEQMTKLLGTQASAGSAGYASPGAAGAYGEGGGGGGGGSGGSTFGGLRGLGGGAGVTGGGHRGSWARE